MTDFDDRLRELRERFVARACEDRTALAEALAGGDADGVRRIVHGLAGAGGTFGYPEISEAAQRIEDMLDGGARLEGVRPLCCALAERIAQLR